MSVRANTPMTEYLTPDEVSQFLDAQEAICASATPAGVINCGPCQDFRSDVSHGKHHPCRHCQPLRFKIWRLCQVTERDTLLISVHGVDCLVMLPPAGGSVVQPCEPPKCAQGCVLVQPTEGGDGPFWAEVPDIEIKTPWSGA